MTVLYGGLGGGGSGGLGGGGLGGGGLGGLGGGGLGGFGGGGLGGLGGGGFGGGGLGGGGLGGGGLATVVVFCCDELLPAGGGLATVVAFCCDELLPAGGGLGGGGLSGTSAVVLGRLVVLSAGTAVDVVTLAVMEVALVHAVRPACWRLDSRVVGGSAISVELRLGAAVLVDCTAKDTVMALVRIMRR